MKKYIFRFKRIMILVAVIIWLVSAIDILFEGAIQKTIVRRVIFADENESKGAKKDESYIDVFCKNVNENVLITLETNGRLKDTFESIESKKIVLVKAAKIIGINRYEITKELDDNNSYEILLCQNSVNGAVRMAIGQDNVFVASICLKNGIDSVSEYKNRLKRVCEDIGIKENISTRIEGDIQGDIGLNERNSISSSLLKCFNAKVVTDYRTNNLYTVYAYDKKNKEALNIGKDKINMNITMSYDEEKDLTNVVLASPINNRDF